MEENKATAAALALKPPIIEHVEEVSYAELSSATVDAPASWSDDRLSDRARLIASWEQVRGFPVPGGPFGDELVVEKRFLRCGPHEQLCLECFDVPCACRRHVQIDTAVPPTFSSTLSWDPTAQP